MAILEKFSNFLQTQKITAAIILILFLVITIGFLLLKQKPPSGKPSPPKPLSIISDSIERIFGRKKEPNSTPTQEKKPKEKELLQLEVAEKIINWLGSLREEKNGEESYSIGYQCDSKGQCSKDPTDKQVAIPVLWSYFHYYNATKKPEVLSLIKKSINLYSKQSFQPDFWHCKLLYDLDQSPLFSPDEKETLASICRSTFLLRFEKVDQYASENDINQFQAEQIINQLENPTDLTATSDLLPKDEREFLIYSTYTSDLVCRYFWFNAPHNLYLAKTYFDHALLFYLKQKESKPASLPFLVLAAIDIYKATKNEEYLKFANYLTEVALEERQANTFNVIGLALLEEEMWELSEDKKYQDLFDQHLSYLINYGFDSSGYQGYRKNLGAFHNLGTTNYIYDTRSNALIIPLLLKQ